MQRALKAMLVGGVILASMMGLSPAPSTAGDRVPAEQSGDSCYVYLCQKRDESGEWYTVKCCDTKAQAMVWFKDQDPPARVVVAQK